MADPKSEDPIRRESTRLTCMAVTEGQTSYDPRFIRSLFPEKEVYRIHPVSQLFGIDINELDNLPAEKYKLLEACSPINFLTKDDPPVLLVISRPLEAEVTELNVGIHHPRFGKVLKEKMDALEIPCELDAAGEACGRRHSHARHRLFERELRHAGFGCRSNSGSAAGCVSRRAANGKALVSNSATGIATTTASSPRRSSRNGSRCVRPGRCQIKTAPFRRKKTAISAGEFQNRTPAGQEAGNSLPPNP